MITEPTRITEHAKVADHVAAGLARLTQKLRGKAAIAALLGSWLAQVQAIEDAAWDMLLYTALDTAKHDQIDQIGVIVGFGRGAITDDEVYRAALYGIVLANRSSGTGDGLLTIMAVLSGDAASTLTEHAPAAVIAGRATPWPLMSASIVASILRRAKSGGVRLLVEDVPSGDLFAFATGELVETDVTHGFSDTDGLVGGQLIGVL